MQRANEWRVSRAARIDRNSILPETDGKIDPILSTRSGVELHALVSPPKGLVAGARVHYWQSSPVSRRQ